MKKRQLLNIINKEIQSYASELERNHHNNIAKKLQALELQRDLIKNNFYSDIDYNILRTGYTTVDSKTFNNGAIVECAIKNALGIRVNRIAFKGEDDMIITYKGNEYHIEIKSALTANALPRITTILNDKDIHKKGKEDRYIIFLTYKGIYVFTRLQLYNAYKRGADCFDTTTKNTVKLKAINLPKTFQRCYELEEKMRLSF